MSAIRKQVGCAVESISFLAGLTGRSHHTGRSRRYSGSVETYDIGEAAARTGVSVEELARMCLIASLVASGIPLEGLAEAIRGGRLSLDFLDAPAFERFSALSGATFAEVAERTGVPVEELLFVREAAGSAP